MSFDCQKTFCLAITGASGAPYALALLQQLIAQGHRVYLLLSSAAEVVIAQETQHQLPEGLESQQTWFEQLSGAAPGQLKLFAKDDWFSPVASGSSHLDAMVICPASGGCLSAIASGASNNLIERAADVCLKEGRPLVLVPRETPVSSIHLENMLKLSRMGVRILPASPGFYQKPESVADLVNFIVARILGVLQLPQNLLEPWGES